MCLSAEQPENQRHVSVKPERCAIPVVQQLRRDRCPLHLTKRRKEYRCRRGLVLHLTLTAALTHNAGGITKLAKHCGELLATRRRGDQTRLAVRGYPVFRLLAIELRHAFEMRSAFCRRCLGG